MYILDHDFIIPLFIFSIGNTKKEKHSFSGVCSKKLEGLSGRMRQFSVQF